VKASALPKVRVALPAVHCLLRCHGAAFSPFALRSVRSRSAQPASTTHFDAFCEK
jgi:hypothetical protein